MHKREWGLCGNLHDPRYLPQRDRRDMLRMQLQARSAISRVQYPESALRCNLVLR